MKKVNEYVKKVNIYIKNYKVILTKKAINQNKEKIYKGNKYMEMCIKVYKNIYIQTWKYTNI